MKKKILSIVMAAVMLLSLPGCSGQEAQTAATTTASVTAAETTASAKTAETTTAAASSSEAEEEYADGGIYDGELSPAVWKVTDEESGNSLYMTGTIHIIPADGDVVPQYMLDIYENSDGIAVEYDVTRLNTDMVAAIKYLSYFVLDDGSTITDHISQETYERAKAYLSELGLYQEGLEAYNSAYWQNTVTSASLIYMEGMASDGVDTYFIGLAKSDGKEVRDIERLETQMEVITVLSDDYNEYAIKSMLDELEKENGEETLKAEFLEIYAAWAQGDTEAFSDIDEAAADELPEELVEEYSEYNRRLLGERNIGMADAAEQYIKNGDNIFYMVGFGHFCGEGSVIDLLEQRGYTVERAY